MHKYFTNITNNKGLTLIELMLAISISTIVIGLMGIFFTFFFSNFDFITEQTNTISRARYSLDLLNSEIREAQSSDEGAYAIVTAQDDQLTFFADVDNDGQVERVRYYRDGSVIIRGVIEPGISDPIYNPATEQFGEVAQFVTNEEIPIFTYYDSNWPGDTVNNPLPENQRLLNVRLIRVTLQINTDPTNQNPIEVTTQAHLRNLKTNI
jgi:prepilin-type N-terminal cleavage/methylation domain-containing protein